MSLNLDRTLGETVKNSFELSVRITAVADKDPEVPSLFRSTSLFFCSVWSKGGNIGVSYNWSSIIVRNSFN